MDIKGKILEVLLGHVQPTPSDRMRFWIGWAASVCAILTFAVLVGYGLPSDEEKRKAVALPFLVFWTVAPPMYFWFDYFVLWDVEKKSESPRFATLEEFKHGQELSRNLWLAIVALIGLIYFKGA